LNVAVATTWASLPGRVRERADQLVLQNRAFAAIHEIWNCGIEPRPSSATARSWLPSGIANWATASSGCQNAPRDLATLISKVQALPGRLAAIEAFWDGDTLGWFVILAAVLAEPPAEADLAFIRHGGDLRLFNGQVPPWPEAQEADTTGRALAQHFGVPFHFASPDTPDDGAPRWRESR